MKSSIQFLALILLSSTTFSQKQNNIWYFGENAGLDFSSGNPVAITNGALQSTEGAAVQADANGNLLFYTNGGSYATFSGGVWNRFHQLMPNGDLSTSLGCNSSVQSCVIVPHPGNNQQYFIFTTDCQENGLTGGLAYNLVDMTLDNGNGDLIVKDSLLYNAQMNENLYAIPHSNGNDFWLISHILATNNFLIYSITAGGIQSPQIQSIGDPTFNGTGQMVANINGNKLAFGKINSVMLFDFDRTNGSLSNYQNLVSDAQGVAFSANCRYLYISYPFQEISQFDLLSNDIQASKTAISPVLYSAFQLLLGPDGRIYINRSSYSSLDVINYPDNPASSVDYVAQGVSLGSAICRNGLPNQLTSWYQNCGFTSIETVQENYLNNNLRIFPNPTDGKISIDPSLVNKGNELMAFDLTGKRIDGIQLSGSTLDLGSLNNGLYRIVLYGNDGQLLGSENILIKK